MPVVKIWPVMGFGEDIGRSCCGGEKQNKKIKVKYRGEDDMLARMRPVRLHGHVRCVQDD
jgi:hypothetical protein